MDFRAQPLVSCITPTANRRRFLLQAIRYFLAQDYPNKELVIVDDGDEKVSEFLPKAEPIRYLQLPEKTVLGEKRNRAAAEARGGIIVHWDDDDWSAPWRLRYQVEELLASGADICGLDRVFFYAPSERRAWEYVYPTGQRPWVYGASLAYRKAFWAMHPFPQIGAGEDTRFVWADARAKIHVLKDPHCLIALMHDGNCSPKRTSDPRYRSRPVEEIERLLSEDLSFYTSFKGQANGTSAPPIAFKSKQRALISAALGIGDILRVTSLIRVAHGLGYEVDVLLATDYPDVVDLLKDAPEIRHIFHSPSPRQGGSTPARLDGLSEQSYDFATFNTWSASLQDRVRTAKVHVFEREQWLAEGDSRCVERIARDLGWRGELPPTFAMASNRE